MVSKPSDWAVTEPTNNPSDLSPLAREALAWVVRLRSGDATKADLEDVQRWRKKSAEHEMAFQDAVRLWRRLQATASNITEVRETQARSSSWHPGHWSTTRRAVLGGAVAASAAGYLLYRPPMELWPSLSELRADYRTGKGERRDIAVAEGVSVTLNTQTSVAVLPAEKGDPRIELIAGEAAVTTRRATSDPLTVQALDVRMIASRATFNARCVDGVVAVTCLDGMLDVESARNLVQLRAGQQVTFSKTLGLGSAVSTDTEQAAAWQKGLLIVQHRALSDVVNEVNRYRTGRIVITNPELGRRLVNGTFQIDRLENFPSQVQQLFGATVRALPGGVVLLS